MHLNAAGSAMHRTCTGNANIELGGGTERNATQGADGAVLHLRLRRVEQRQCRVQRGAHGPHLRGVCRAVGGRIQQEAIGELWSGGGGR